MIATCSHWPAALQASLVQALLSSVQEVPSARFDHWIADFNASQTWQMLCGLAAPGGVGDAVDGTGAVLVVRAGSFRIAKIAGVAKAVVGTDATLRLGACRSPF